MTTIRRTVRRSDRGDIHDILRFLSDTLSPGTALTCLFGTFVFLQFTVLGLANHAGEGYLSTARREQVYYYLQVFVILGYVLYSRLFRIGMGEMQGTRVPRTAAYAVLGLFVVCVTLMLTAGADSLLNVIVSMTAALCLGGIGGAAHIRMSMAALRGEKVVRSMGLGSAAAVVLQYLLQIRRGVTPLLSVFLLSAFILFVCMLRRFSPEAAAGEAEKPERPSGQQIVFTVLIAATFILFTCFYNESIHHLMIQSGYTAANVYSWPRLMLVPVYLLFAFIGDRKNGKYMPIITLCIMLVTLLNIMLIGNVGTYWLSMCFFYCAIAAYTSYNLTAFWRLAPGTKHPALWASFGRILDSAMVLFTGVIHLSEFSLPLTMGVNLVGIAMVVLLMAFKGELALSPAGVIAPQVDSGTMPDVQPADSGTNALAAAENHPDLPVNPSSISEEEALEQIRKRYALTRRETEVLRELVQTEDKQTEICERLSIQPRTLQNHVTQLYRKTGATTRSGLTGLFHDIWRQD